MDSNFKNDSVIVVRRASRNNRNSHHGGAWKIAFADFAMSLLCLFLVLWIMSFSTPQQLVSIANYFHQVAVFKHPNSPYPIDLHGAPEPAAQNGGERETKVNRVQGMQPILYGPTHGGSVQILSSQLQKIMHKHNFGKNMFLQVVPEGLKIELTNSQNHVMFKKGSAQLTPYFVDLLLKLAPILASVPNKLVISGHTDSMHFLPEKGNNWHLSTERALSALRTLEFNGLPNKQVLQVVGMSDKDLADPNDPSSGTNRRVDILVLTKSASQTMMSMFSAPNLVSQQPKSFKKAEQYASENQPVTDVAVLKRKALL
ncbi:flagellar motor protein MotB [Vibrio marisflavi]|uniref:Chemotaxis protein LafU n=1 Tax=Vibrio marisflavi CECT 7928 TaxID=634439 RepID=A0ABM9A572_9VIBR|nr:flagellar motor protein MotB [Vibrio marisflavi]CAH0540029.1 Chemotaxis protein LafU [Vibrio marisflavi CECT 7928]